MDKLAKLSPGQLARRASQLGSKIARQSASKLVSQPAQEGQPDEFATRKGRQHSQPASQLASQVAIYIQMLDQNSLQSAIQPARKLASNIARAKGAARARAPPPPIVERAFIKSAV